ncbi:hypothetical protein [Peribacillus sp. Hz7]|uniref:hypothetical protein n=1 Tax=Peribacillus sp. Hz7 TaxID=3344873 RepID=UPI0035C97CF0
MNKCASCNRPLPKDSKKIYCNHCKAKKANIIGKIGRILAVPALIFIGRKIKK